MMIVKLAAKDRRAEQTAEAQSPHRYRYGGIRTTPPEEQSGFRESETAEKEAPAA